MVQKAISCCYPHLPTSAWFEIYQRVATRDVPGRFKPLLAASYFGISRVAERLPDEVFKGANVKDPHGRSAVSWAAGEGHDATVQLLLGGGVVRRLLGTGVRINAMDRCGWTPLHWAARNGHDSVVERLLEAGAGINVMDRRGRTRFIEPPGMATMPCRLCKHVASLRTENGNFWKKHPRNPDPDASTTL